MKPDASRLHLGYIVEPPYPTFFVEEILALRRRGARVTVFNSFRPFPQQDPAAESLRAESHYFPPGYEGVLGDNLGLLARQPAAYVRATAFAARHGLGARVVLLAAHYARLAPRLGIAGLHATYATTPATIALLTSWMSGIPFSFTAHAYDIFRPNPLLPAKLAQARFMTTISEFNKRYIQERYGIADGGKIHVVHLGVDTSLWRPAAQGEPRASPLRMACVAHFYLRSKGHQVLLEALALLRERGISCHAVLIGEGPLRPAMESRAQELGLGEMVTFMGALPSAETRRRLSASHLFVLPCLVDEEGNRDGLPVALMEAMALGLPVVTTPVTGIPELVEDRRSGRLVKPGDPVALAEAMAELASDPELRERLGRAGRERVQQSFELDSSAARMIELFGSAG